ncbi:MAG: winged helix-turn-helix domain-containing protein [Arenimonas sp.]
MKFQIADALVDFDTNRIERADGASDLEPKVADVLRFLVQHAGQVVSREDLLSQVWNTTHVSDDVITRCVNLIRRSFDDNARNPRVLQTITRRGYRLIADVQQLDGVTVVEVGRIIRTHAEIGTTSVGVAAFLIGNAAIRSRLESFIAADMERRPTNGNDDISEWHGNGTTISVRTIADDLILRIRRKHMTFLLPLLGSVLAFLLVGLSLKGPNGSYAHIIAGAGFAAVVGGALGYLFKTRIDQQTGANLAHRRDTIIAAAVRE